MKWATVIWLVAFAGLACTSAQAADAMMTVCVRRDSRDASGFAANCAQGPIRLPAGFIFDLAGRTFGGASDPLDGMHSDLQGGWRGVTTAEQGRRERLMLEDASRDQRHKAGLVTLAEIVLSRSKPCASMPVAAALSPQWGWTVSPVFGAVDTYYQAYGVLHDGVLNTDWTKEASAAVRNAGASGAINGVLQGTTARAVSIQ